MFLPLSDRDLTRRSFPIVNVSIIGICIIVFIYELLIGNCDCFFYKFGLIPYEITKGTTLNYLCPNGFYHDPPSPFLLPACDDISSPVPTWATIFTAMFVHGGWLHFLGNMLFLWVFGDNIEDRFGHLRYLLFYLGAGLVAGLLQIAIDTNSIAPVIGASGAIAGVLGAYLLLYPYSRIDTLVFILIFRIPAIFLLGFWFLLQFYSGVGELGPSSQGSGVAYWAHIGGFLFGMAIVAIYKLVKNEKIWPGDGGGYSGSSRPPDVKYWRGRPIDY